MQNGPVPFSCSAIAVPRPKSLPSRGGAARGSPGPTRGSQGAMDTESIASLARYRPWRPLEGRFGPSPVALPPPRTPPHRPSRPLGAGGLGYGGSSTERNHPQKYPQKNPGGKSGEGLRGPAPALARYQSRDFARATLSDVRLEHSSF